MSRAEMLAKMTPHGPQITGEGFGGFQKLTMMDIAGALGMGNLDHSAYLFGILKYCGDHQVMGRLDRIIRGHVYQIGKFEGWNLTDAEVRGLAALSLFENLHSPVCDRCNGSCQVAAKPCDKCSGSGRLPLSNRRRAIIAGIPEATWRRDWKVRAARCYQIVSPWDAMVAEHLNRQFREVA